MFNGRYQLSGTRYGNGHDLRANRAGYSIVRLSSGDYTLRFIRSDMSVGFFKSKAAAADAAVAMLNSRAGCGPESCAVSDRGLNT